MTPSHKDFWFLPLGGTGEIGMNLNLYGHAGCWLMVDCGVTFEKVEGSTRNRVEMADPSFIANRSETLVGLIATHAHEDHIGAIAHLWPQLRCPIYTTPFTRNVLLRKLREKSVDAPIITVPEHKPLELGPFRVTWLPITHSTPETNALLIETPLGEVLHTADWKLDSAPIVGDAVATKRYAQLGSRGLLATVCDSTNATVTGHSVSESELFEDLLAAVRESAGRVVVACFSSNIARLQTLGHVARLSGRYIGLAGRSLQNMVRSAKMAGYLSEDFEVVDSFDLGYLLPEETLVIATGSQGEPRAALHRLAADSHRDFNLSAGDHVIFSSKTIPGNEEEVARLLRAFEVRNIKVTHADNSDRRLHASGHPCSEELELMYQWSRPRLAVPVHGEARHMQANAAIAERAGVPRSLVGRNGDLYDLVERRFVTADIPTGRLWLEDENGQAKLRRV
jgi:ribonuclease J